MTDEKKPDDDFGLVNDRDEAQIIAELSGVPVLDFVYINRRGVAELTYAGTKWAVRELAQLGEAIRVTHDPLIQRCPIDPEHIIVTVRGARHKVDRDSKCELMLDTSVGAARNWKNQKLTNGTVIPDENFFKKAVGIATRNAMQSLLPQEFLREMIDVLAEKRRALEGGAKPPPKKAAETKKPGAPAVEKSSAAAAPATAKSSELPAGVPGTPAGKEAPKSSELPVKSTETQKSGEKTLRQKLFITLNHFEKDIDGKRKLLLELTGKGSSKELDDLTVTRLTAALERSLPGKVNELRSNPDGSRFIVEKPTQNILHGVQNTRPTGPPAAAPAGDEEEPF
jgi:hypothetical protein